MIPKIISQIWFQFAPDKPAVPPPEYDAMRQSWRDRHPDWEIKLWNEAEVLNLLKTHYPWAVENWSAYDQQIHRVDAARYFILHFTGGVYVDCDTKCLSSLEPLRKEKTVLVRDINPALMLNNGFMACRPGDPLMYRCAKNLHKSKMFSNAIARTGPHYLSINYFTGKPEDKKATKILTVKQLNEYFYHRHDASWTGVAKMRQALDPERRQFMKLEDVPCPLRFFLKGKVGQKLS